MQKPQGEGKFLVQIPGGAWGDGYGWNWYLHNTKIMLHIMKICYNKETKNLLTCTSHPIVHPYPNRAGALSSTEAWHFGLSIWAASIQTIKRLCGWEWGSSCAKYLLNLHFITEVRIREYLIFSQYLTVLWYWFQIIWHNLLYLQYNSSIITSQECEAWLISCTQPPGLSNDISNSNVVNRTLAGNKIKW